jgi:hypothetical protein
MIFIYLSEKEISSFSPALSRPTSCIPNKSNLNIADSLSAVSGYRGISSPLTFHVPNLTFISVFYAVPKEASRNVS